MYLAYDEDAKYLSNEIEQHHDNGANVAVYSQLAEY